MLGVTCPFGGALGIVPAALKVTRRARGAVELVRPLESHPKYSTSDGLRRQGSERGALPVDACACGPGCGVRCGPVATPSGTVGRMMNLEGNAAVVTGGASGLGEATARRLAQEGALVTICDINDAGEQVAQEIGGRFMKTDVTDYEQVTKAVEAAADGAPLRAVVHCAGTVIAQRTIDRDGSPHDPAAYDRLVQINLVGTFHLLSIGASQIAKAEPYTGKGHRGAIVMTASVAAYDGQIGQLAYSATKGGVVGMTLPAARDLSAVGIRVNTIAPGLFNTPIMNIVQGDARVALENSVVFPKRLGEPSEYADLAAFLIKNDYMNGEVIRCDGAIRMAPK